MKNKYFIPDTHDQFSKIVHSIIDYMLLFMLIMLIYHDTDVNKKIIMLIISFVDFVGMSVLTISRVDKTRECSYSIDNILLMKNGELKYFIVYSAIIIILVAILHSFNLKMILFDLFVIIYSYFSITLLKYKYSWGMYINEKDICCIGYKKCYLNVDDIAGIKVERAQFGGRGTVDYYKTTEGYIYCMIFLKKVKVGMNAEYYGSIDFRRKFPETVIAETAYDAEVIDYLKQLNPNIIVMRDIR